MIGCLLVLIYLHYTVIPKLITLFAFCLLVSLAVMAWIDSRKRRRRSGSLVLQKRRRRILPFVPSEDPAQRLKQMGSLASALTALHMEFSDDLTYMPGMAPRSANKSKFEDGGMQVFNHSQSIFPLVGIRANWYLIFSSLV